MAKTTHKESDSLPVEFARIEVQYRHLTEKTEKLESALNSGMESIRKYLQEAIDLKISALVTRIELTEKNLETMQKTVDGLMKKVFLAMGGIGMLTFLISLAVTILSKFIK